ncbi:aspartyl protease family protein [Frigoriflavimonas asaccharolytica]|uniref:Aspartyl protease n=1 Tax=Frigoriflavimonas asaccharolytica TaxID=2735899 RepID=A0A8J8G8X5_9FLAO|nr:aspartyl protease family protein [Frigoriflavimonas asaccharolytica]NRS93278.1 hypothetical protein [Frigoriflavimonas asaccharolytica]
MKWFLLIFVFFGQFCFGQSRFTIPSGDRKITIPFQLINNLIFVEVELNSVPLTFLVDTGVNQTLLISKGDTDINFTNAEKIKFTGLGGELNVDGLKSTNNMMKISEKFIDYHHTVYIILDEFFNFSAHVGIPVHGIIGYDFFQKHQIQIDYSTKRITIYNDAKYFKRKTKSFAEVPISIDGNKPYVVTNANFNNENNAAKLLIDIGNSDALWLFPSALKKIPVDRPNIDDFLGRGFNGDIFGKRTRIEKLILKDFVFDQPITSLPDSISIQQLELKNERKGSIGSEIMRRLDVVFDYPNRKIYIKKNRFFEEPFLFNKSGLDFKHIGVTYEKEYIKMSNGGNENNVSSQALVTTSEFIYKFVLKPVFAISSVRSNSSSYFAGLQKDDVLQKINGRSTSYTTLSELNEMMKQEDGKTFKFEILRGGYPMEFTITLKDPIPYQK